MVYFRFTDPEPAYFQQGGDKAVLLPVERQVLKTASPVDLQRTAAVVDPVMDNEVPENIGAAGDEALSCGILPALPPAGNHIQVVLQQGSDQHGDIRRVALSVAVQRGDQIL